MSKRRSLVSSFGDLTKEGREERTDAPSPAPARSRRVGAGAVAAAKRPVEEMRQEIERLKGMVEGGRGLVEIDPTLIDPSPFPDRLPDDGPYDFEQLKVTIAEQGQKLPIMVRRHPDREGRFQSVYGHRRARALRELGKPALAQVVEYSDRELLMAQGIENSARQDLTWIEKALFAAEQTAFGLKAREIRPALGVDDQQLSKMRTVTNAIPRDAIEAIGRAPRIGRPRWLELAALAKGHPKPQALTKEWSSRELQTLPSDERFEAVLASMKGGHTSAPSRRKPKAERKDEVPLASIGRMTADPKGVRIIVDKEHVDGFRTFLSREAEDLVKRYLATLEGD